MTRWQHLPAARDQARILNRYEQVRGDGRATEALALSYGVTSRTLYRYARRASCRAKAEAFDRAWASLHDLSCRYPDAGCSCRAVLLTLPLRIVA